MAKSKGRRGAKGAGSAFQRADGRWVGQVHVGYDEDGKAKYASRTAKTEKEAVEKMKALQRELDNGTYTDVKTTVKQYLTTWLEDKKRQVEPKTLEGYTRTAKHLSRQLGGVQLTKLTPVQVQRALGAICDSSAAVVTKRNKGIEQPGAGVRTANQCRTNLHTALEDAVRMQLIARNPVTATKPLKAVQKEDVVWTLAQMQKFLEVAQEDSLRDLFIVAVGSGLRRGELLGLRWRDVEVNAINVRQAVKVVNNQAVMGPPKSRSSRRRVVVSPEVISALEVHRELQAAYKAKLGMAYEDNGLVFANELGKVIHPRNLERTWYRLQERTRQHVPDLPHGGIHSLRSFHATLAIRNGMDAKMLSERLGHTDVRLTLNRYARVWDEVRSASAVDISSLLVPPVSMWAN